jgi:hypothetical protein
MPRHDNAAVSAVPDVRLGHRRRGSVAPAVYAIVELLQL